MLLSFGVYVYHKIAFLKQQTYALLQLSSKLVLYLKKKDGTCIYSLYRERIRRGDHKSETLLWVLGGRGSSWRAAALNGGSTGDCRGRPNRPRNGCFEETRALHFSGQRREGWRNSLHRSLFLSPKNKMENRFLLRAKQTRRIRFYGPLTAF